MNSESVDLIYLDPPFNSNANYAAPVGSKAAGAAFKDTWTLEDIDVTWLDMLEGKHPELYRVILAAMTKSDKSYLIYMAVRLLEMERILKPTGSIYLHCDPTMSHYIKLVMDAVFGRKNFRNEIVWCYTRMSARGQKQLSRAHDVILWYTRSDEWNFNVDPIRLPYAKGSRAREGHTLNKLGSGYSKEGKTVLNPGGKFPEDWITHIPYLRGKERTGYPTQKPLALLERIIKASSNEGDMVLDPFCGCATTLVAADHLQRQWVGIDYSPKTVELVTDRIKDAQGLFEGIISRTDCPQRTDLRKLPPYNCPANKNTLYGNQGGYCGGCRTHFEKQHLEVDHHTARSQGGTDDITNLQLLCSNCNRIKGNRGMEYLMSKLEPPK